MPADEKRLFFGLEVFAPWPLEFPHGRLLDESHRHVTLAFLGQTHVPSLMKHLSHFPTPPFKVGLIGKFSRCLLLPKRHPNVIAWEMDWLEEDQGLLTYQKTLSNWLHETGFTPADYAQKRDFLPHVTLCRSPFSAQEWQQAFMELPFVTKGIHLYESLGHSKYQSLWHYPIQSPFEEFEHTADIAFYVRGIDYKQLYRHALIALAFHYPPLLSYFSEPPSILNLEEVIMALNAIVTRVDGEIGSPFKAISFHDKLTEEDLNILSWEMIVDV